MLMLACARRLCEAMEGRNADAERAAKSADDTAKRVNLMVI